MILVKLQTFPYFCSSSYLPLKVTIYNISLTLTCAQWFIPVMCKLSCHSYWQGYYMINHSFTHYGGVPLSLTHSLNQSINQSTTQMWSTPDNHMIGGLLTFSHLYPIVRHHIEQITKYGDSRYVHSNFIGSQGVKDPFYCVFMNIKVTFSRLSGLSPPQIEWYSCRMPDSCMSGFHSE